MTTAETKSFLLKNMSDAQLAKTIQNVRCGFFKLMSKDDIHSLIKEACSRKETTDKDLIDFQDFIVSRYEAVILQK